MIRIPRLSLAVFALVLSTVSATAHAQFSAYGMFSVTRMTDIQSSPILQTLSPPPCTGTTTTNCTAYSNFVNPLGFTGGVSWDFKTLGPATLALDLRGSIVKTHQGAQAYSEGAGAHTYSGLGGIKASFNSPIRVFRPYVQASAGIGRSNYGVLTNAGVTTGGTTIFPGVPTQNNLEYHIYAGGDLRFAPWGDWRVFEAGYGALHSFGTYSHDYPVYSISTGVVFHIPPRP
jgi:hypothetical protein